MRADAQIAPAPDPTTDREVPEDPLARVVGSCGCVFASTDVMQTLSGFMSCDPDAWITERVWCARCRRYIYFFIPHKAWLFVGLCAVSLARTDGTPALTHSRFAEYNRIYAPKRSLRERLRNAWFWFDHVDPILFVLVLFVVSAAAAYVLIPDDFLPDDMGVPALQALVAVLDDIGVVAIAAGLVAFICRRTEARFLQLVDAAAV